MLATRRLLAEAQRQPLIRFLGKRSTPAKIDHTPHQHPAATSELPSSFTSSSSSSSSSKQPNSFAEYRQSAQQHGPLRTNGPLGGRTGHSLGSVEPAPGIFFDKSQLGAVYGKLAWSQAEMEAIESGGATMW